VISTPPTFPPLSSPSLPPLSFPPFPYPHLFEYVLPPNSRFIVSPLGSIPSQGLTTDHIRAEAIIIDKVSGGRDGGEWGRGGWRLNPISTYTPCYLLDFLIYNPESRATNKRKGEVYFLPQLITRSSNDTLTALLSLRSDWYGSLWLHMLISSCSSRHLPLSSRRPSPPLVYS